ncbi:hypothetical protein [Clostridium sp.]|uniref:hypothetical protein n=1 Tax=Clostridium sp. TaxID=1506 RepID=UPI002FDE4E87
MDAIHLKVRAVNETMALALESLEATWGHKYPLAVQSWKNNWVNLSTYFELHYGII